MKTSELRAKSDDELNEILLTLKKETFNLRFQQASGQLTNTSRFKSVRRQIARTKTVVEQRRAKKASGKASNRANRPIDRVSASPRVSGSLSVGHAQTRKANKRDVNSHVSGTSDPLHLVASLCANDVEQRIDAMKRLGQTPLVPAIADLGVSRLIPLLASENEDEAIEAAIALCKLVYPQNYERMMGSKAILKRVRSDLPDALHKRRVDYFTVVEAMRLDDGRVRVDARLRSETPFKLDGKTAVLCTPKWIQEAQDFSVTVSGPGVEADGQSQLDAPKRPGDIGAVVVECNVSDRPGQKLNVDFVVDHRLLKRERLAL